MEWTIPRDNTVRAARQQADMAGPNRAPKARIPRDNARTPLQEAVDAFLSQTDFSVQTHRSYAQTLRALVAALDVDGAGSPPSAAALEAAVRLRWGTVAPATCNRHAATVRSFPAYAARKQLLPELSVQLEHRRQPADRTRALPRQHVELAERGVGLPRRRGYASRRVGLRVSAAVPVHLRRGLRGALGRRTLGRGDLTGLIALALSVAWARYGEQHRRDSRDSVF